MFSIDDAGGLPAVLQKEGATVAPTKRLICTVFGFTCLYAIAIAFFYYDWLFDLSVAVDVLAYECALNISLCIGAGAVVAAMRGRVSFGRFAWLGGALYFAAFAGVCVAQAFASAMIVYVSAACAGVAAGILVPLWFLMASRVGEGRFGYVLGIGSLACGFIVIGVNTVSTYATMAALAALLLASLASFFALQDTGAKKQGEETEGSTAFRFSGLRDFFASCKKGARLSCEHSAESDVGASGIAQAKTMMQPLVLPLVYVAFLSVVYGALDGVANVAGPLPADVAGVVYQVCGVLADAFFLLYVYAGKGRYSSLFNALVGMIAAGLFFLPFLSPTYGFVLLVFVHAGWGLALLVSYALSIEVLKAHPRTLVAGAAIVFALPRPGVLAGSWATSLIVADGQAAFARMTILAFVLLYVVMAGIWAVRTREKRAADKAIRKRDELIERYARARDDLYKMACSDMAKEHALTKREGELLYLYAQGRDAAYIEAELILSRNTVKSYTKSLYAKIGVHSRQELIDAVKASLPLD